MKVEWFCIVKGKSLLVLEILIQERKLQLVLSGGRFPQLVKMPPAIVHAIGKH
jgi:hypothetical protein